MNQVSHPAYESWPNFKEELEVKFPPSWVELVSHEEVINNISCKKKISKLLVLQFTGKNTCTVM